MKGKWTWILPIGFVLYSLPIFLRVNAISESIIDEEFHIPQGLAFCNKEFEVWDSKITTFPGLYLFALVLSPINFCTITGLRLLSLFAAGINILLLYKIRCRTLAGVGGHTQAAMEAITLAVLPPLYFFAHLYYTDTLALTMVLFFYYYWHQEDHLTAAVFAAACVLMRQTNIVWVCMCSGITAFEILKSNYAKTYKVNIDEVSLFCVKTWFNMLTNIRLIMSSILDILTKCCFYFTIILPFIGFVFINGSIVVGDKSAHEATVHFPQLFYFSLFTAFFAISNNLCQFKSAFQLLRRQHIFACLLLIVAVFIIKWNTLVHPYLLADNRHYIFYIWNRLYGRYWWFKYAMAPVYVFMLTLLFCGLQHMRDSFKIMFWLSVILVLCFQRLLEMRYFLVPFLLFRLNTRPSRSGIGIWSELGANLFINVLTFYVFFTKEFYWENYKAAQRIIW